MPGRKWTCPLADTRYAVRFPLRAVRLGLHTGSLTLGENTMALVSMLLLSPVLAQLGLPSLQLVLDAARGVCVLCW